jgi:hypothetical protein
VNGTLSGAVVRCSSSPARAFHPIEGEQLYTLSAERLADRRSGDGCLSVGAGQAAAMPIDLAVAANGIRIRPQAADAGESVSA